LRKRAAETCAGILAGCEQRVLGLAPAGYLQRGPARAKRSALLRQDRHAGHRQPVGRRHGYDVGDVGQRQRRPTAVEVRVLPLPLGDAGSDPEKVDAQRDEAQEQPLDPVAEQCGSRAAEDEREAVDVAVLGAPALAEDEGERIADPDRASRYEEAEKCGADIGRCAAVEANRPDLAMESPE
jgi:hypothetical protein